MNRKQVVFRGEAEGLGLGPADRLAVALGAPVGALDCEAVAEGDLLGVAEREGLPVIERLLPIVLLAAWPVGLAPGDDDAGSTVVAAPSTRVLPPLMPMMPIAPTATAAAAAPPTTRVRFLRLPEPAARECSAPEWPARPAGRRSRRRAPGPDGSAPTGSGSHTALIAGP